MTMLCLALLTLAGASVRTPQPAGDPWTSSFSVDKARLVATGSSRYFILEPGFEAILEDGNERVVITVTNDTKRVDGVTTRIVEERETKAGKLIEVSRNFFALDPATGDMYYFGEEVDIYKNGKIAGHDGAWTSGVNGARFGLFVPGEPAVGRRFYQEVAPGVAMDRVRIVATNATVRTPAGTFDHCLKIEETTPLEPRVKDYKLFAPGAGLVQDGALKLIRHGRR